VLFARCQAHGYGPFTHLVFYYDTAFIYNINGCLALKNMKRHILVPRSDGTYDIKSIGLQYEPYGFFIRPNVQINHILIPNHKLVPNVLSLNTNRLLGKGSYGLVFKAQMEGMGECSVKIPKLYVEYGRIQIHNGKLQSRQVMLTSSKKEDLEEADAHFKKEIRTWLYLQMGKKMQQALCKTGDQARERTIEIRDWLEDIREAKRVQVMDGHQFIHPILEFNLTAIPCVVSEICTGSLLDLCCTASPSPFSLSNKLWDPSNVWEEAMISIAHGLCYMHRVGLAHGDLKPNNLLYKQLGPNSYHFYLTDFGGSLHADELVEQVWYIPEFSPPAHVPRNYLPKGCDAYAFAVTGFVLLIMNRRRIDLKAIHEGYIPALAQEYIGHNQMITQLIQIYRGATTQAYYESFAQWCNLFLRRAPPRQRPPNHYAQHAGGERQQVGGFAPQQLPRPRPRQPDLGCTCC
jgi:serine/threonine protein kinase